MAEDDGDNTSFYLMVGCITLSSVMIILGALMFIISFHGHGRDDAITNEMPESGRRSRSYYFKKRKTKRVIAV